MSRHFKLLDRELVHALDDGETYMLIADVSLEDQKLTLTQRFPQTPRWVSFRSDRSQAADKNVQHCLGSRISCLIEVKRRPSDRPFEQDLARA